MLNHALAGIPEDRIRYHACWGSWHGPHTYDLPLKEIVDIMLTVRAGAYLVEAGNVRHELDWQVWQEVKLPEGKLLGPGVVSHATNVVDGYQPSGPQPPAGRQQGGDGDHRPWPADF